MSEFNKLIMGAIVGSALGVLFAPEKGENVRKNLHGKANATLDKFKTGMDSATDELEGLKLKIEDKLKELSKRTSDGAEDGFKKEREKINKIIDELKGYVDKKDVNAEIDAQAEIEEGT